MADCPPGVRKVLKSEWEVVAVSPGVADHVTLGVAAGAGLVGVHVALAASAGARSIGDCARGGLFSWGAQSSLKTYGKLRQCPRDLWITPH